MKYQHPNEEIIDNFYKSFQQRDHAGMIACYHPDVTFSDPVFPNLRGKQAMAMWHMLCERGQDLQVSYSVLNSVDDDTAAAHWEAHYTFGGKRKVHNVIDANFVIQDGKIIDHKDDFDLWRWTRMAIGFPGVLLGWSPIIQNKVRQTAKDGLESFIAKHPEYQV